MSPPLLRLGASSPAVAELHLLLAAAGAHGIGLLELVAERFGAETLDAVHDFQGDHCGPDGHALAVDGIVGPLTWWALRRAVGGTTPGHGEGGYTAPESRP